MSTYSKGKRFEKRFADHLKEQGHELLFKSIFVRFQMIDFGGVWDLVSFDVKTGQWNFWQCKKRKSDTYGQVKKDLTAWAKARYLGGMRFWIVWEAEDGKGFEMEELV